jgi:primosomal protein N' (replication factor Y)
MGRTAADSDQAAPSLPQPADRVVGVAVHANVWRSYDYLWPDALGQPQLGQRLRVPFGRGDRRTLGFVVDTDRRDVHRQLKTVVERIDESSQLDETLWKLGEWISRYYLTPLGMVLAAMVPSVVGRYARKSESVVYLASERKEWGRSLGARQRQVLDELLEARKQGVEPLAMESLLSHSKAAPDTIRRLERRGLVRCEARPVRLPELSEPARGDEFVLNDEQQAAMDALMERLRGGFSCTLLYGVTGSGKTEIYVRAMREVIAAGRQAMLLVPEIALATQTLQRLVSRLPRVAVLHSALSGTERAFYWDQIRQGHAAAVVGPRSAVFAPARRLGLIIVDEEHETSYKQDTAPRYHGRDVAVKRAALTDVPVVLGSATPSLESFHNVQRGRYHLLRLPHRVRGLPMPKLQVVALRREMRPGRVELIGRTLTARIAAALDRDEQIILLLNRRGFASYVFCPSCGWEYSCDNCTRAMVFHQATQLVMCHYCGDSGPLPERCPACRGKLLLFGLGIQRIEGELARKFPAAHVARMDSDTMTSPRQFRKVFEAFAGGEVDILLGTQMVAKGLDFPRVSLVGVASADTSLAIPDFRASERTFQLIVQVAGRAGRAEARGEVVVQTLHPEEPAVKFALGHDFDGFAAYELPTRRQTNLPPFSRMIRFVVRQANVTRAEQGAAALAAQLRSLLKGLPVTFSGPQRAEIFRIRNQFRFQVLLTTSAPGAVQEAVSDHMERITRGLHAEVVADVDPVYLA